MSLLNKYPEGVSFPVPEMIPVPGGSIELRDARTNTSRTAELRDFSLAAHPVTWELYSRVMAS